MAFDSKKLDVQSANTEVSFKKYTGIGQFKVLAINPTREELNKLLGSEKKTDPIEYVREKEVNVGGKKVIVPSVRVSVWCEEQTTGMKMSVDFFVDKVARMNGDGSKVCVMDEFGRTAWATVQDAKAKKIPVYSSGNLARIDKNYTVLMRGEEELQKMFRALCGCRDVEFYDKETGTWKLINDVEQARGKVDDVKKLFDGNWEVLRGIACEFKDKTFLAMVYIENKQTTKDDGTEVTNSYMRVYTGAFGRAYMRNGSLALDNYAIKRTFNENSLDKFTNNGYEWDFNFIREVKSQDTNLDSVSEIKQDVGSATDVVYDTATGTPAGVGNDDGLPF